MKRDVQTLNETQITHLPCVPEIHHNEMQTTSLASESSETSLLELHTAVEEFTNNLLVTNDLAERVGDY